MATLKTNYQNEVLATGYEHRVYNIKKHTGRTSVETDIYLERVDTPQNPGTSFQAEDVNAITKQINTNTQDIQNIKDDLGNVYNKTETDNKLNTKQNTISYGSSLPRTGTEGQMFILI